MKSVAALLHESVVQTVDWKIIACMKYMKTPLWGL